MLRSNRVLIIGPFPNPLTGLNIANQTLFNLLKSEGKKVSKIDMEINRGLDNSIGTWRWYKLRVFFSYFQIYKVFNASIVYCTIGQSFFGIVKYAPFVILASLLRKKKFVHLHGNALFYNYTNFSNWKQLISLFVIRQFHIAIVLSKSLVNNFENFLEKENIVVCNNFISLEPSENINKTNDALKILFLGNLLPAKGIIPFLESMEDLSKRFENIEIKVSGIVSQDFPQVISMMDNVPSLNFLGKTEGVQKSNLFEWADVFVMPTLNKFEGQPLVILEAMHKGCYIIATDCPGISDIIGSKNGELLKRINSRSISKAIEVVLVDRLLLERVKSNNREYSIAFSLDKFKERILDILSL